MAHTAYGLIPIVFKGRAIVVDVLFAKVFTNSIGVLCAFGSVRNTSFVLAECLLRDCL